MKTSIYENVKVIPFAHKIFVKDPTYNYRAKYNIPSKSDFFFFLALPNKYKK
jgi:hypothetical protein